MARQLAGKRVVIIEDEALTAEQLAYQMTAEGAEVIGPAASVLFAAGDFAACGKSSAHR